MRLKHNRIFFGNFSKIDRFLRNYQGVTKTALTENWLFKLFDVENFDNAFNLFRLKNHIFLNYLLIPTPIKTKKP